jgi:hypothetical protein
MVRFYLGTELSKKLQLSNGDKDKCNEFINQIIDNIYLYRNVDFPKGIHPIFDLALNIKNSNGNFDIIEKSLRYHLLSSDYRGYKFLEYLLAVETYLSKLLNEHPYQIYHKLISYLGEEYIFFNSLINNKEIYFKQKNKITNIITGKISEKTNEIRAIITLSQKQLEYLLTDLNPIFIVAGLKVLPEEYKNKILSCFTDYSLDLINLYANSEECNIQLGDEFIDFISARLNGSEQNSFEIRRESYYYSRLYKGNEFTYRLNSNYKQKSQFKEIILIFLGISGKIREVGFKNSIEILDMLNSEDYFNLKMGLTYVLEGWQPMTFRYILENQVLSGDYKGIDFLKRLLIIDGCHSLALNISEHIMFEKFIQTIGEENRIDIEKYINDTTNALY